MKIQIENQKTPLSTSTLSKSFYDELFADFEINS